MPNEASNSVPHGREVEFQLLTDRFVNRCI